MKRSRFKARPPREETQIGPEYTLRPREVAVAGAGPARASVPVPKDYMIQHGEYMAAVRSLACDSCGALPRSVFCHADIVGKGGKGMGIKSDCRLGWPGCRTCHYAIGTSGKMSKEHRHLYEFAAGRRTRAEVWLRGLWPADLPAWPGDKVAA